LRLLAALVSGIGLIINVARMDGRVETLDDAVVVGAALGVSVAASYLVGIALGTFAFSRPWFMRGPRQRAKSLHRSDGAWHGIVQCANRRIAS